MFDCGYSTTVTCAFVQQENIYKLGELNTFLKLENDNIGANFLHGGSLKIAHTPPFNCN